MGGAASMTGAIAVVVLMLGAHAAPPASHRAGECLEDRELTTGGITIGDSRSVARRRLGARAVVWRDTVRGADYAFDVTRFRTERLELVVSEATGRVAEIIPRDTTLWLPRGVRLGMPRSEVELLLSPAVLAMARGDTFSVIGCGPRGSGVDLVFDRGATLRWASLTGFYSPAE